MPWRKSSKPCRNSSFCRNTPTVHSFKDNPSLPIKKRVQSHPIGIDAKHLIAAVQPWGWLGHKVHVWRKLMFSWTFSTESVDQKIFIVTCEVTHRQAPEGGRIGTGRISVRGDHGTSHDGLSAGLFWCNSGFRSFRIRTLRIFAARIDLTERDTP